jgi:hypothetical protein
MIPEFQLWERLSSRDDIFYHFDIAAGKPLPQGLIYH